MAPKKSSDDAKTKAAASAPVAKVEETSAAAGEASTAEAGASETGEAVNNGAPPAAPQGAAAATSDVAASEAGSAASGEAVNEDSQPGSGAGGADAANDELAAVGQLSGPTLTGAVLELGDGTKIPASDITLPELSKPAASDTPKTVSASAVLDLMLFDEPNRAVCSVLAPNGPRWRAGIQFGSTARNVTVAELGADPKAVLKTLVDDPHLRIGLPIDTE